MTSEDDQRRSSIHLGAGERVRTADLPLTRRLLCLLSYTGWRARPRGRGIPARLPAPAAPVVAQSDAADRAAAIS